MARLQINSKDPDVSLDAIVPEFTWKKNQDGEECRIYNEKKNLPVLWLLHGLGGNCSDWTRYSQIELYAEENEIIVLCPSGENGFFVNMNYGVSWEDNMTLKLWEMAHSMLPTSDRAEDNYIAGVGMGGYGALKIALDFPEQFSCAASFDGWLDISNRTRRGECPLPENLHMEDVFGRNGENNGEEYDLWELLERYKKREKNPRFYLDCSVSNSYYQPNLCFTKAAGEYGYEISFLTTREEKGWRTYNAQVSQFMSYIHGKRAVGTGIY